MSKYGICPGCGINELTEDWPHPDLMWVTCSWCDWPVPEKYLDTDDLANRKARADFTFDKDTKTWHYHVPSLNIFGGGTATRWEAQDQCEEAISFALERP